MKWPWRRRHDGNGVAARAALAESQAHLQQVRDRTAEVDRQAREGRDLARRADLFAREVERALRRWHA